MRRFFSFILILAMIISLVPLAVLPASAETYSGTCGENLTWTLDFATNVLEITGTGKMYNWVMEGVVPWYENRNHITSILLNDGVTSIGDWAFAFSNGLTSVTIPDSVTSIGDYAFNNCEMLTSMTIPDSVKSIGYSAFTNCAALSSVIIPDSVTSIGGSAFYRCTGLTSLRISDSVTSIGDNAFGGCTGLTSVTIPGSVTSIDWYAFGGCTGLTSVRIPDSVTRIGDGAFSGCTGLTSVRIPDSVTSIGNHAFSGCTALTSVRIPDSVTSIGNHAFFGCTALTRVTVGYGVEIINTGAFSGCTGLTTITLGNGVKRIGWGAFYGCDALTDVYFLGTEEEWNAIEIDENSECLTEANMHFGAAPVCEHGQAHPDHMDAICTEAGYDRMICDDCGVVISETILPALGHSFVSGVCTRCGAKDPNYKPAAPTKFNDVKENSWYYDAVNYTVENKLMNGVGNNNFAPNDPMTRAMLVTVLWRYEGEPKEGENTFSDVPDGQWYTKAVAWAADNGIVGGVGNGKFDPNGNITREQMAAILYRYAQGKGFDTSKRGDLSGFPDRTQVSAWATDAIVWAVGEKIIGGSDGKLLPQGNATRAQVSTILMRFIENFAK